MRILGIDPSSKTGYVALTDEGDVAVAGTISYPTDKDRYRRFHRYANKVAQLAHGYGADLVVLEGFSFAGKFNNSFQYELGACIRYRLNQQEIPWIEVPPTSLKKFVSGKGNIKKDLMLLSVYKRWDFDTESDNEADAYGLAQFGRAIIGKETGVPAVNFTAVETVLKSDQPALKLIAEKG